MPDLCAIDWPAFGLEPPDFPCDDARADFEVSQSCVHEHVARSLACYGCFMEMLGFDDPAEWTCGPCILAGHACPAPLRFRELAQLGGVL